MRRYDHNDHRPRAPYEQGPSEKKGYTCGMIGNPRVRSAQRWASASRKHEHDGSTGHACPLLRVCGLQHGTIPPLERRAGVPKGSGQCCVKMYAKPQLVILQSVREAKILE